MRKVVRRSGALVLLPLLMLGASTTSAQADPTPSPSPTIDAYHAALNQYKIDRETFLNDVKVRGQNIRMINKTFNVAIEKANSDYAMGLSQAKTPAQKFQLASNRMNAKSVAIAARDAAIAALGPEPIAPTEPPAPVRGTTMKPGKGKRN